MFVQRRLLYICTAYIIAYVFNTRRLKIDKLQDEPKTIVGY